MLFFSSAFDFRTSDDWIWKKGKKKTFSLKYSDEEDSSLPRNLIWNKWEKRVRLLTIFHKQTERARHLKYSLNEQTIFLPSRAFNEKKIFSAFQDF